MRILAKHDYRKINRGGQKFSGKILPTILIEEKKGKTINNQLSAMESRGLLPTVQPYGETLTLFGRKELERLYLVVGLRQKKTSAQGGG